jgi:hypothetical protein
MLSNYFSEPSQAINQGLREAQLFILEELEFLKIFDQRIEREAVNLGGERLQILKE